MITVQKKQGIKTLLLTSRSKSVRDMNATRFAAYHYYVMYLAKRLSLSGFADRRSVRPRYFPTVPCIRKERVFRIMANEKIFLKNLDIYASPEDFAEMAEQFQQLMMMYSCAIKEIQTKLEILNDEFQSKRQRNPIEYIKCRLKKPKSILEKLKRKGLPNSPDSLMQLNDIAGIRVVCSFIDDIYKIADMLIKQDDITLIETQDYIKNPKPSGYRSLHLVVEVPVFFSDSKRPLRVEVQIRTIAMDFWASLEHRLHYKTDGNAPEDIVEELRDCSDVIAETDERMQRVQNLLL